MSMTYSVKIEGLQELHDAMASAGGDATKLLSAAMLASAARIQQLARSKAPHRTGTLQRSIQVESSSLHAEVKVGEKYGVLLEQGTGIYGPERRMIEIRPKNKKALYWPGAAHPVAMVRQKGIKARPYFGPAITSARPYINQQLAKAAETILRNIAKKAARGI